MSSWKVFGIQVRAINSIFMVLLAIPVAISSLFLYFAPIEVSFRKTWSNGHIFLGFILLGSIVLHVFMNWRALRAYLRKKIHETTKPRVEGAIALAVFVVLLIGVIAYPGMINMLANVGLISADSRLVTSQSTSATCSACPYLYNYGGCHSGDSFEYDGTTYYGYDTTP